MRGVYLTYSSSSADGQRRLTPRVEDHVILPVLSDHDVVVQVKACALSRVDTKLLSQLGISTEQVPVGSEISGIVTKVGSSVHMFSVGDEVMGILPLDSECPGCAEYCSLPEYYLVKKPSEVSHSDAAATLRGGVMGYTALHHQCRIGAGSIVLLCSAASGEGLIMLQLCKALGAKVIAVVHNDDEASLLKALHLSLLKLVDLSSTANLVDVCLQETGSLGVNCIIDDGVSPNYVLSDFLVDSASLRRQLENERHRYEYEDKAHTQTTPHPRKHQLISCLATRGQWVTREPALQLDPPDSQLLLMKGASLHFLFEPGWTLSGANQGDYLDMLTSIAARLEDGTLKPYVYKTIILDQVCEELGRLGGYGVGKIVMTTENK